MLSKFSSFDDCWMKRIGNWYEWMVWEDHKDDLINTVISGSFVILLDSDQRVCVLQSHSFVAATAAGSKE